MTIESYEKHDLNGAILRRGHLALEALKSREQAALFHAAHADLQVALFEAETGNDQLLRHWLDQYRALIEREPDLPKHLANVEHDFATPESATPSIEEKTDPYQELQDTSQEGLAPLSSLTNEENRDDLAPLSPLTRGGAGGDRRATLATASNLSTTVMAESPWPAMMAGARLRASVRTEPTSPLQASSEPTLLSKPVSINPPWVLPTSLTTTLCQDKKSPSTKKWTWLSSSIAGSTLAHLIALVAMSTYMLQMARKPEVKAIIASSVDTDTVSMDSPVELNSDEVPDVDVSDSSMPALPSFETMATATSSDIRLPTAMAGLLTSPSPSSQGGSIEQAMKSSIANAVANSVEFFGLKATGNTFCYVVDSSPSMKKDGAFAAAKAELARSLSWLKPKQRYYICFFGGDVERLKLDGPNEERYPVYATRDNLQKTLLWIDRVRVQERGMPPNNALGETIQMDPDGIFLLFDGDTKVDVAAHLRKVNRSDDLISGGTPLVPIHTIGFYTQEFESLMKRIALENNGSYRFIRNPKKP